MKKSKKHFLLDVVKHTLLFALVIILIIIASLYYSSIDQDTLSAFIISLNFFGPLIIIFIMAVAIVISPIPSFPIAVAAGSLYGGFLGGVYSLLGAEIGAVTAFMIARKLGRAYVEKRFKNEIILIDKCYENSLPFIIFVTRLVPAFQFDVISYAAGLTNIKLWKFALATFLGMMPVTFLITFSGESFSGGNVWFSIVLSVIIVLLMYFIPKLLRKRIL